MYPVGTKVNWVEIRQSGHTKRYLLPYEQGIIDKLRTWMIEYGTLFLARYGEAELTQQPVASGSTIPDFEGLIFTSESSVQAKLYGAELTSGTLRICTSLIEAIQATQAAGFSSPMEQGYTQQSSPEQAGLDELRQKLSGSAMFATPVERCGNDGPAVPDSYNVGDQMVQAESAQNSLRQQLAARQATQPIGQIEAPFGQPVGANRPPLVPQHQQAPISGSEAGLQVLSRKLDTIQSSLDRLLFSSDIGKGSVSGKELGTWFMTNSTIHGMDATWDMLAACLTNVPQA
jgi:hypothetical protein